MIIIFSGPEGTQNSETLHYSSDPEGEEFKKKIVFLSLRVGVPSPEERNPNQCFE